MLSSLFCFFPFPLHHFLQVCAWTGFAFFFRLCNSLAVGPSRPHACKSASVCVCVCCVSLCVFALLLHLDYVFLPPTQGDSTISLILTTQAYSTGQLKANSVVDSFQDGPLPLWAVDVLSGLRALASPKETSFPSSAHRTALAKRIRSSAHIQKRCGGSVHKQSTLKSFFTQPRVTFPTTSSFRYIHTHYMHSTMMAIYPGKEDRYLPQETV